jgi:DNA-binding FrmR family transcriptional regulator
MKSAKLVNRLHRIQGQLTAVEKMIESDKGHREVLIQIEAVISSMKGVKAEYIKELIKTASLRDVNDYIELIH